MGKFDEDLTTSLSSVLDTFSGSFFILLRPDTHFWFVELQVASTPPVLFIISEQYF